jgi:hypothetical protein
VSVWGVVIIVGWLDGGVLIIVQWLDEGALGSVLAWLVGFVVFCGRRAPPERKWGRDKSPGVSVFVYCWVSGPTGLPFVMPGVWTGV